jgi:glycosyltransferase involved in cell wall biosynthesis
LAEHLASHGHQVSVVASRGGYTGKDTVEGKSNTADGLSSRRPRVYRVWTPRLGKATVIKRCIDYACFYLLALWRMLRLRRQDVIISLTTPPFIASTAVAHRLLHPSTRIVLWCMDCYPELAERSGKLKEFGWAASVMRWFNRALFRRLDHLVCLDSAMVSLLMSQYAPARRRLPVTVIPNWEDASFFPRDAQQSKWGGIDELKLDGRFVVLYLGNMGYGHSFETVLDAAVTMKDEPVTFLFIGGGSRREGIASGARERGLSNVIVRDYVPKEQTPSVMASTHCALITLRDEILGVMSPSKLHSNLAMRLPVVYVGPEGSNVDDAIREFDCGCSVRHGDAPAVVAYLRRLMTDRGFHEAARERARQAFERAYCDTVTLPRFGAIIAELAERCDPAAQPEAAQERG